MFENGRHVRRKKILVVRNADYQRTSVANADEFFRFLLRKDNDSVGSLQLLNGLLNGIFQCTRIKILDQVGDDFGVRLGRKLVALFLSRFLRIGSFR